MKSFTKPKLCFSLLLLIVCHAQLENKPSEQKYLHSNAQWEEGGGRRHLTQASRCPDGTAPVAYRCGCDTVTPEDFAVVSRTTTNNALQCLPICGADDGSTGPCASPDTEQDECTQYACVRNSCGVSVDGAFVDVIRGGCTFDEASGWQVCRGGFTVDTHTAETVANGACVPACGQPQFSCQFNPTFGPPIFPSPSVEEDESEEEVPDVESNCEVGAEPDGFICSCQAVSAAEMQTISQALLGQETRCVPYCGDPAPVLSGCRKRRCGTDVCIGPRENVACSAFVGSQVVNAITSFDCTNDEGRNTVVCRKGTNFLEVDRPSFDTIKNGVCLSGCGLERAQTSCRFNPIIRSGLLDDITPTPAPASAPASEPAASESAPASEPEASESAPASEPEASESAPASEPEASESAPASEPEASESAFEPEMSESAPASEPDASDSAFEPELSEPGEEPMPSFSAEEPEALESIDVAPGSEPEIDLCKSILQMQELAMIDGDDDEIADVMFQLPPECLGPVPEPSAEPELEPDPEPEESVPSSEPGFYDLEAEPAESPDFSVEAPESEIMPIPEPSVPEPLPGISLVIEVEPQNMVFPSKWGECAQYCQNVTQGQQSSKPVRQRALICRHPTGVPLPKDQCTTRQFREVAASETCNLVDCGNAPFVLSPFSACTKKCAEFNNTTGMLDFGTQTRTATCINDGRALNKADCDRAVRATGVVLEQSCNTGPCEVVQYRTTAWSKCNCSTLRQTRRIRCVSLATNQRVSNARCQALNLTVPARRQACQSSECLPNLGRRLLQDIAIPANSCNGVECSGHGTCKDDGCECDQGFSGVDCQFDDRDDSRCRFPGMLDAEGKCCPSGVFDLNNSTCCEGNNGDVQLDIDGNCCDGHLDWCGVCNGNGVLDVIGRCCDGALDGAGLCCASGAIDECGICDGDGSACLTTFVFQLEKRPPRVQETCERGLKEVIADSFLEGTATAENISTDSFSDIAGTNRTEIILSVANVRGDSSNIERLLANPLLDFQTRNRRCEVGRVNVDKQADCGNGRCETGEPPNGIQEVADLTCEEDCNVQFTFCELTTGFRERTVSCSGHGRCLYGDSGRCDCFEGYTGDNCENCADGFYKLDELETDTDTRCFPRQNYIGIRDGILSNRTVVRQPPGPKDPPSPEPSPDQVISRSGAIRGISINAATNEDSDDDIVLVAVLVPILGVLFVLLALAFYAVRRRHNDVSRTTAEAEATKTVHHHPAISENQAWRSFKAMLARSALPARSRRMLNAAGSERLSRESSASSQTHLRQVVGGADDERAPGERTAAERRTVEAAGGKMAAGTRQTKESIDRGLGTDSPKSSIASPTDPNRNAEPRRHGLLDVKKWDTRKYSMKKSTESIDSSLLQSESDRDVGPSTQLSRGFAHPAVDDDPNMTTIDEGQDDRETHTSMQIHGAPSDVRSITPHTAASHSSHDSEQS